MEGLIWAGAAVSLAGLAGLVWCILYALRARLQRAVVVNLAALLVSAIGLMMIVIGILLG